MKTKQTGLLNGGKSEDKRMGNTTIQSIDTGIPNTDVLGMEKQDVENPGDKIHGKTQLPKTENKTGKNNLKKGSL